MKKHRLPALLLVLALTACGANQSSDAQMVSSQPSPVSASEAEPQAMTLRPTDLSQESRTLLSIFGNNLNYFDYTVDTHIQSLVLDLWCFDGTEWTKTEGLHTSSLSDYQHIAVLWTDSGCDLSLIGAHQSQTVSLESSIDRTAYTVGYGKPLEILTPIHPDREILLDAWYYYQENPPLSEDESVQDFRDTPCDAGIAVTATFSSAVLP